MAPSGAGTIQLDGAAGRRVAPFVPESPAAVAPSAEWRQTGPFGAGRRHPSPVGAPPSVPVNFWTVVGLLTVRGP